MPHDAATAEADDQALLGAWRGGDEHAFAALVARHSALVRARCARHLPADLAEDAAQAVFLLLARKHADAARAPCLEAWLLRVAQYVVNNARRERARRMRREQEVAAMRAAATAGDDGVAADLDEALDRLPEHERRAIVLRFLRGCDDEETARILGVKQGTVRSRVSRGLERLRALLARRKHALGVAAIASLLAAGRGTAGEAVAPAQASATALRLAGAASRAMRRAVAAKVIAVALGGIAVAAGVVAASHRPSPRTEAPSVVAAGPASAPARSRSSPPAPDVEALRALLDPDAELLAGLHDVARARERWDASPYAAFAASPTGRAWIAAALGASPGLARLADCDVRSVALGARGRRDDAGGTRWDLSALARDGFAPSALWSVFDATIAVVADGDASPLAGAVSPSAAALPSGATWSEAGADGFRLTRDGAAWYATNRAVDAGGRPQAAARPAPFVDRDADLEARFHDDVDPDGVAVTARVGADGLRTLRRWTPPADASAMSAPVRFAAVAALPRDTIAVWARSLGATRLALDAPRWPAEPNTVSFTSDFFHDGLRVTVAHDDAAAREPGDERGRAMRAVLRDLAAVFARARGAGGIAVDGDVCVWLQPTTPLPALSLRLDTPDADALVARLAEALGARVEDGACRAVLGGVVPVTAARVDRALVVTTHPRGVAGCLADRGFAADPAVSARVVDAERDQAYALVLLRDGAALRWLASLGVVPPARVADLAALCGERCDVVTDRAAGDERACAGTGVVAGLLALLIDPGTGQPPWRGLTN